MNIIEAIVIAIVEGITEFLPISSTGHMIITSTIMGIAQEDFTKLFTIAIQFGAILSVVALYWKRFFKSFDFYLKLLVAFIPSAIFGLLLNDLIDSLLGNVVVVGVTLLLGGIVLLFVDKWFQNPDTSLDEQNVPYPSALKIGLFQVISMIPGVSRSAATIIGGLTQKLTRTAAAEFSFFLAVPTMFAATCKKLYDYYKSGLSIDQDHWVMLGIGNLVAFVVAWMAIRTFISYLTRNGFKAFGYYRIVVGAVIIVLYLMGIKMEVGD